MSCSKEKKFRKYYRNGIKEAGIKDGKKYIDNMKKLKKKMKVLFIILIILLLISFILNIIQVVL